MKLKQSVDTLISLLFFAIFLMLSIFAIKTSSVFDEKISSITDFLKSISSIYYLLYFLMIGLLTYYGYSILKKEDIFKFREYSLGLGLILLFSFLLEFPRLLFTNPFPAEVYHTAQIFYVAKHEVINIDVFPYGRVGNPIFWAIFADVTLISDFTTFLYLAPLLISLLETFFLYVIFVNIGGRKLAFIGAMYFISSNFFIPFAANYSFGPLIFILLMGCYLQLLRGTKPSRSFSLIVMLIFITLVISHVLYSLIFMLTVLVTFLLYKGTLKSTAINLARTPKMSFIFYLFVVFLAWEFLQSSIVFPYGYLKVPNMFVNRLVQGKFESGAVTEAFWTYPTPEYQLAIVLRLAIGILFLSIPFFLALYLALKRKLNTYSSILFISYILSLIIAFMGFYVGIMGSTPFMLLLHLAPFLLVFLIPNLSMVNGNIKHEHKAKGTLKVLFFLILIVLPLIFYIKWTPYLIHIQIPLTKVSTVEFTTQHASADSYIYVIGSAQILRQEGLFKLIYGNRTDLRISLLVDPVSNDYRVLKFPHDGIIFLDGSVLSASSKWVFEPSLSERMRIIETDIVESVNVIYTSSPIYKLYTPIT
jgi:hypothetical protein